MMMTKIAFEIGAHALWQQGPCLWGQQCTCLPLSLLALCAPSDGLPDDLGVTSLMTSE